MSNYLLSIKWFKISLLTPSKSCNFSLSYSESDISICLLINLTLSATASFVSLPTTIVVSSLVTVIVPVSVKQSVLDTT